MEKLAVHLTKNLQVREGGREREREGGGGRGREGGRGRDVYLGLSRAAMWSCKYFPFLLCRS